MNLAALERKGINVIKKPISAEAIAVRDALVANGLETPMIDNGLSNVEKYERCLLYTSPSPRDKRQSRMPSSA